MALTVRQATQSDLPQLSILFDQYRTFYQQPSDVKKANAFLTERLLKDQSTIFVALDTGETLLGFVQLYPIFSSVSAQSSLLLNDLFVHQDARKLGVGRALMDAAKELAHQQGDVWIMLQTTRENQPAQRLYESLGYQKDNQCLYYYLPIQ